jgi:hypothetical protein
MQVRYPTPPWVRHPTLPCSPLSVCPTYHRGALACCVVFKHQAQGPRKSDQDDLTPRQQAAEHKRPAGWQDAAELASWLPKVCRSQLPSMQPLYGCVVEPRRGKQPSHESSGYPSRFSSHMLKTCHTSDMLQAAGCRARVYQQTQDKTGATGAAGTTGVRQGQDRDHNRYHTSGPTDPAAIPSPPWLYLHYLHPAHLGCLSLMGPTGIRTRSPS